LATLSVVPNQQPQQKSEEPTREQPVSGPDQYDELLRRYGLTLIQLVNKTRDSWQWKRRGIVLKVLKNKEMLKGNHHIGFYPGTVDSFDAMEEYSTFTGSADPKNADRSMDQRPHNFYQMLEKAFVSALSADVPKSRFMPENADVEEDRETAKAGSRVNEIIERSNKIKTMLKQELMELFTSGSYVKHTRYVVDSDLVGTHKETAFQLVAANVLPARYQCFNCGMVTPEDELVGRKEPSSAVGEVTRLACPHCGTKFGPENYFEDHVEQIPVAEEKQDVANGMVIQSVYGPLHYDADPDAEDLKNTGLLNISQEVRIGWLRSTFPTMWEKVQEGQTGESATEQMDRQYRDMLTTPAGYSTWSNFTSQNKPTYSRTWIQPMLFAEVEGGRALAEQLQKDFPQGCMIAFCGDVPLQIRPAKLTDEWTWCGSEQKGFGLFPNPVGDPAVPVQERINDCISKIDEYMDRLACGILLANEKYIDSKAMNGKQMLPGLLNPVMLKSGAAVSDLQSLIFQVKAEIDAQIFTYLATLKQDMELLVSTPPQTFGAGTQEGVETMGGQRQQLDTGMMKMGLNWDNLREEHAEAAENAIKCAGKNMTEDWKQVVTDETEEFMNEYVHLDQMKGSVHAEPETDQGFPMTWADIRAFYQDMFDKGGEILDYLMQEPENIDNALRYIAIPGLKAPGAGQRDRILIIINMLSKSAPQQAPDPMTGEPIDMPSVLPIKELDSDPQVQKLIINWVNAHWDKLQSNQAGLDNILAYYKAAVMLEAQVAQEKAMLAGPQVSAAPAAQGAPTQ
jgi:hypothetical protein